MSEITIILELTEGRYDEPKTFPIFVKTYEPLNRSIRRVKPLKDYDIFYNSHKVKEDATPSSLGITTYSTVCAYKLATKEEQKEMREHLKSQRMDADKFSYYQKGDMAVFQYDVNSTPSPKPVIEKKSNENKHKWGKGRRLGTR